MSPRPLRLLHLLHSVDPVHGGPVEGVRQSVLAARALDRCDEVLSLDDPAAPAVVAFPAPTHAVGPGRGTYGWTPRLLPWLRQHAARFDALVVHGLWQYPGLAARRAALAAGVPYFVYPHGMLDPWFRRAHRLKHAKKQLYWLAAEHAVLRDASAVLFTTAEEARLAPQSFRPYRVQSEVLGYGLALDPTAQHAQPDDFLRSHPALRGRRLLLFLGRLHPKKGCDLLIEAFAALAGRDEDLHLVMAGPDGVGLRHSLECLAGRLGVGDRVTWTGMLEGPAKWGALRAAEAFVLPSHQENFGIAVAEALAVGTPVLVSTQVNIWREIVQAQAGLAGPDTLEGTRAVLAQWLAMPPSARAAMRAAAQPCFDRHFHIRASVQGLATLVRAAQARHAPPLPPDAVRTEPDSQPCHTAPRQSAVLPSASFPDSS